MADFRFKKFVIRQDNCAMKVNTDGVLLAAWMSFPPGGTLFLEIGTGSGVMALIASQRAFESGAEIDAVEIDSRAIIDAKYNFEMAREWLSPKVNLNAIEGSVIEYVAKSQKKYNLIFSNPPYFTNSLKSGNQQKMVARHNDSLSQSEIIKVANTSLAPEGLLSLIYPTAEAGEFKRKVDFIYNHTAIGQLALVLVRECYIQTTPGKETKRQMLEFKYVIKEERRPPYKSEYLTIHNGADYSAQYKALTAEFYLNF